MSRHTKRTKIDKLREMTVSRGCSEHEADTAAKIANDLAAGAHGRFITVEADFAKPDNLDTDGERAYAVIVNFLVENNLTYTGGCTTFYSPMEWRERGEDYGCNSKLIVVYEGSDVRRAFSLDGYDYDMNDKLNKALEANDLFSEECTMWYSAVYASKKFLSNR